MSDSQSAAGHHGPTINTYLAIFGALCIFTAVSFVVNAALGVGSHVGMGIIMVVAVCKATLVGMFFMHLKYEWFKLYFLIVPVAILCVMMIIVLMPDGVVYWHHEQHEAVPAALAGIEHE